MPEMKVWGHLVGLQPWNGIFVMLWGLLASLQVWVKQERDGESVLPNP